VVNAALNKRHRFRPRFVPGVPRLTQPQQKVRPTAPLVSLQLT
jgi:hypothetical protein